MLNATFISAFAVIWAIIAVVAIIRDLRKR